MTASLRQSLRRYKQVSLAVRMYASAEKVNLVSLTVTVTFDL